MAEVDSLYNQTSRLIQETQEHFYRLDRAKHSIPEFEAIEAEIRTKVDIIARNCNRLDILCHKEPVSRRRHLSIKIEQLKYDHRHISSALQSVRYEWDRNLQEQRQREELLQQSFTYNRNSDATTILVDHSIHHQNSLQNANRGVDDLISSGSSILDNLRDQRNTIKGAHRKILDIANTLGLSNTTMRFIERRRTEDMYILFLGMFITLVIIFLIIYYF
nr:PREDICTED: Golgi SNAP receptor complex member 2 [Bemisia tabaci]